MSITVEIESSQGTSVLNDHGGNGNGSEYVAMTYTILNSGGCEIYQFSSLYLEKYRVKVNSMKI